MTWWACKFLRWRVDGMRSWWGAELISWWVCKFVSWGVYESWGVQVGEPAHSAVVVFWCVNKSVSQYVLLYVYKEECLCCVAPQSTHTSQFTETRKVETTSLSPQSKHSTLGVGNKDVCKHSQPFCLINIILTAFHCAKQRLNTKRLRLRHWKKHKTLPCYEIKLLPLPFELWGNRHT